jgi:hypothetical protein
MVAVEPSLPRKDSARSTLREKSVFRWKYGCPRVKRASAAVLGCAGAHSAEVLTLMLTLQWLEACVRDCISSCESEEGIFSIAQQSIWATSECGGDLISGRFFFTMFVGFIYMGLVRRKLRIFVRLVGFFGMFTIFVGHNCGWLGAAFS